MVKNLFLSIWISFCAAKHSDNYYEDILFAFSVNDFLLGNGSSRVLTLLCFMYGVFVVETCKSLSRKYPESKF